MKVFNAHWFSVIKSQVRVSHTHDKALAKRMHVNYKFCIDFIK